MANLGGIGVLSEGSFYADLNYSWVGDTEFVHTMPVDIEKHISGNLNTTYQTSTLNLSGLQFQFLENAKTYYVAGTVTENDTGAARKVRIFNRETAVLLGETMSNADGSFRLEVIGVQDEFTVIAYDDATGTSYNATVFDKVVPVEVGT